MTLLISHRGNLNGPNPAMENNPVYIQRALDYHYPVEVDLWRSVDKKLYLGHDKPQYVVPFHWLRERRGDLWIHCKNSEALSFMTEYGVGFNYFFHQNDPYTLTSQGYVWCHPNSMGDKRFMFRSISVLPEIPCCRVIVSILAQTQNYHGICTDFVSDLDDHMNRIGKVD